MIKSYMCHGNNPSSRGTTRVASLRRHLSFSRYFVIFAKNICFYFKHLPLVLQVYLSLGSQASSGKLENPPPHRLMRQIQVPECPSPSWEVTSMLRKGQWLFQVAAHYIFSQKMKEGNDPNRLAYSLSRTLERNKFSPILLLHPLLPSDPWGRQTCIIMSTLWIRKPNFQKDKGLTWGPRACMRHYNHSLNSGASLKQDSDIFFCFFGETWTQGLNLQLISRWIWARFITSHVKCG